jgi:RimJ/RimL family protein N-acetyltransferase
MEKDDLPLFVEWVNKPEVSGKYNPLHQMSKTEAEKMLDNPSDIKPFIIEKKDGSKIGFIVHFHVLHLGTGTKQLEIGYSLVPSEKGRGYGTEAVGIIVDYLFLSKDIMRIQAQTDQRNVASQKVLEKVGFKKEGTLRKNFFMRENGQTTTYTAFLGKNGENQEYLREPLVSKLARITFLLVCDNL